MMGRLKGVCVDRRNKKYEDTINIISEKPPTLEVSLPLSQSRAGKWKLLDSYLGFLFPNALAIGLSLAGSSCWGRGDCEGKCVL